MGVSCIQNLPWGVVVEVVDVRAHKHSLNVEDQTVEEDLGCD